MTATEDIPPLLLDWMSIIFDSVRYKLGAYNDGDQVDSFLWTDN